MMFIVLNTLVLSLDRYPESSDDEKNTLYIFNLIFTFVFTSEVAVKMIGLGYKTYISDRYNIFDLIVVLFSIVELVYTDEESGSKLGALRAIRLFRVFKLFKQGELRILMDSIAFTVGSIGNYTILLCLFIYVMALLGMSIFAGKFQFREDGQGGFEEGGVVPPANFDELISSCVTIFQIMIGDNWTTVMYDGVRGGGNSYYSLYFIMLIILGNIIMLNLFLAILLGNFERARDFGVKKKLFDHFVEMRRDGKDLSTSITAILEDISDYVKVKILKWPKEVIEMEEKSPDPFIREMLEKGAEFMDEFNLEFKRDAIKSAAFPLKRQNTVYFDKKESFLMAKRKLTMKVKDEIAEEDEDAENSSANVGKSRQNVSAVQSSHSSFE